MQSLESEVEKQANEGGATGGGADKNGQGSAYRSSLDEKQQRIRHNQILAEHFNNKSKDPHGSLQKFVALYESNQSSYQIPQVAPVFNPANLGSGKSLISQEMIQKFYSSSCGQQSQKSYQHQSQHSLSPPSDLNSILLFNIAAMNYSVQNFGQALLYLKLILENLEAMEDFIQVKSLFLTLQVLFELRMPHSAKPILDILEVKKQELEKRVEYYASSEQEEAEKASTPEIAEAIEQRSINTNGFSIAVGAFLRRNAVQPKNVNMQEFNLLLCSFKAMFNYLTAPKSSKESESFITKAFECRGADDPVRFQDGIQAQAVA